MTYLRPRQYAVLLPAALAAGLGLVFLLDRATGSTANYAYIILYSLVGGLFSLVGGVILLSSKRSATRLAAVASPFAAGALLATAFLDLLPEGLEAGEPDTVLMGALAGILIFFFAERFMHWFHHNHTHVAKDPSRTLIVAGDTVHNALDGVAIAAAFLVSVPTGIVTTIVVAAHEIPHEVSDFGLLLNKGMSRLRVLLVNAASALATTAAALVTFALGSAERLPLGLLIGISAGLLLYIAMSDLIPELQEQAATKRLFHWQPLVLVLGAVLVGTVIRVAHGFEEHTDEPRADTTSSHTEPASQAHFNLER